MPIQGFDNQGGTRQLDEVRFVWEGSYQFDYRIENTGPTGVLADDYFMHMEFNSLHVYGPNNDVPFYVPSAIWEPIGADLGANDEAPGGSDEVSGVVNVPYTNTVVRDPVNFPVTFDIFDAPGEIHTTLGGFGSIGFVWINEPTGWDPPSGLFGEPIYPIDDAIWLFWSNSVHAGSLTVEYEYSLVPAPGAAGLLACGLAFAGRRRR
jgi:hypothetical protein